MSEKFITKEEVIKHMDMEQVKNNMDIIKHIKNAEGTNLHYIAKELNNFLRTVHPRVIHTLEKAPDDLILKEAEELSFWGEAARKYIFIKRLMEVYVKPVHEEIKESAPRENKKVPFTPPENINEPKPVIIKSSVEEIPVSSGTLHVIKEEVLTPLEKTPLEKVLDDIDEEEMIFKNVTEELDKKMNFFKERDDNLLRLLILTLYKEGDSKEDVIEKIKDSLNKPLYFTVEERDTDEIKSLKAYFNGLKDKAGARASLKCKFYDPKLENFSETLEEELERVVKKKWKLFQV